MSAPPPPPPSRPLSLSPLSVVLILVSLPPLPLSFSWQSYNLFIRKGYKRTGELQGYILPHHNICSKLYSFVTNKRITKWIDDNEMIGEEQAGFRQDVVLLTIFLLF